MRLLCPDYPHVWTAQGFLTAKDNFSTPLWSLGLSLVKAKLQDAWAESPASPRPTQSVLQRHGWLWVDRKPAIPSTLENGFCVHHNKKAFLPSGGEEAARLAQSNPSLKGGSVLGLGISEAENEEGWGWVTVLSLSHSSAAGGKGMAGVFQIGLPRSDVSMVTS